MADTTGAPTLPELPASSSSMSDPAPPLHSGNHAPRTEPSSASNAAGDDDERQTGDGEREPLIGEQAVPIPEEPPVATVDGDWVRVGPARQICKKNKSLTRPQSQAATLSCGSPYGSRACQHW